VANFKKSRLIAWYVERMMGFMPEETQQDWQFEHAMTTMFTCRSVIKFNTMLSNEQRQELIRDIDQSLQFLRSGFISASSLQMQKQFPQHSASVQAPSPSAILAEKGSGSEREALQSLYRMYHIYRDQHQGSDSFVTRFTNAMSAISTIQTALEQCRVPGIADAHPLDYVCAFIADLYYVFVEFIRALSEILEASDASAPVETEKLSPKPIHIAESETLYNVQQTLRDTHHLALLYRIYEAHQSLITRYGPMNQRVQEAKAFLVFLEEALCGGTDKREEFMLQFSCVSRLLGDLAVLVEDYERITAILLLQSR
jgi:hypothetical protein